MVSDCYVDSHTNGWILLVLAAMGIIAFVWTIVKDRQAISSKLPPLVKGVDDAHNERGYTSEPTTIEDVRLNRKSHSRDKK